MRTLAAVAVLLLSLAFALLSNRNSSAVRVARLDAVAAALEPVKTLVPLSGQEYTNGHAAWQSATDQITMVIARIEAHIVQLKRDHPAKEELRILSIGSGYGFLDIPLLKFAKIHFPMVKLVGIDPSTEQCKEFRRRLRTDADAELEKSVFIYNSFFQEWQPPENDADGFDIIWCVQMLYYTPKPMDIINRAASLLRPGAHAALIIVHAPLRDINKLAVLFWRKQLPERPVFSEEIIRAVSVPVVEGASSRRPYAVDVAIIHGRVDLSETVVKEASPLQLSLTAKNVINFMCQTNILRDAPAGTMALVLAYVQTLLVRDNGRWVADHPTHFLIIKRAAEEQY